MSDPIATHAAEAADTLQGHARDARVEQLLLAGLDRYFAAQYEQAIHVWTRVLFLDRGHARARAYIERARSAAGERQREADELLHRGTAAFDLGQSAAARRLLTAAIERGAATEVPLAYLGRLDRLDALPASLDSTTSRPARLADAVEVDVETRGRRSWWHHGATAGVVLVGLVCGAWLIGAIADLSGFGADTRRASAVAAVADPLLIPRASDLALARARALFSAGHARDALQLLATVPDDDPNRADADVLLADIQRTLLATSDPATADAMGTVR